VDQSAEVLARPLRWRLAQLYAVRWEHELYFRDQARVAADDVLQSHTVITAAQEIAAIVLATRSSRANAPGRGGQVPRCREVWRVLTVVQSMWFYLGLRGLRPNA